MNIGLVVLSFEVSPQRQEIYPLFITKSEITLGFNHKRNSLCCKEMLAPFLNTYQLNESLLFDADILSVNLQYKVQNKQARVLDKMVLVCKME